MRCHQISGSLPAVASFGTIVSALGDANQGVVSVLLPAMADETLASVGMVHGPLVAVRDARMLGDGSSFVHLETELAEWIGPLRDNDEESWCACPHIWPYNQLASQRPTSSHLAGLSN